MSDSRIIRPGGRQHYMTKEEAANVAADMGNQVYKAVAEEHKKSVELMVNDFNAQLAQIRGIVALNLTDLQRRSFGFCVAYDLKRFRQWAEQWYWTLRVALHLMPADDGVIGGIEPDPPIEPTRTELDESDHDGEDYDDYEAESVGAPTEQPRAGSFPSEPIPSRSENEEASRIQGSAGADREEVGRVDEERRGNPRIVVEKGFTSRKAKEPELAKGEGQGAGEENG